MEPPRIGDEIFVPTRLHVSRGPEDFRGGRAVITDVFTEDYGGRLLVFVEIAADPGGRYNWTTYLGPMQDQLRQEYADQVARPDPDLRPEFDTPIKREVPQLRRLVWLRTDDALHPYETFADGQHWLIRINDFPAEILYTLLVDGEEAQHLNEWPDRWQRPQGQDLDEWDEPVPTSKENFTSGPRSIPVVFRRSLHPLYPFKAKVDGQRWVLRINDFPVEPYFTLLIDGDEVEHFNYDEVPEYWEIPWKHPPG